jgi:PmbA protein
LNIQATLKRVTDAEWEVYIQHSQRYDLHLRQGGTEAAIQLENAGYGVRIITKHSGGGGIGFASCNSETELEATAKRALQLGKENRSSFFELPTKKKLPSVKTVDPKIVRDPEGTAQDYAEATQSIIGEEKGISLTYGKVRTYVTNTQIINNRGLSCESKGTWMYLEMTLKVGSGSNATEFWPSRYARRIAQVAPDKLITEWLKIARTSLKRHPPKTEETTVIFSPAIACDVFVPTLGFHASCDALEQKLSQFSVGAIVASDQLTVMDDGLYPYGLQSNPFDDEGYPQQKTRIIEKGVFKNYTYDQLHAQTMHSKPTGNGIRTKAFGIDVDERFQAPPSDDTTNLVIKPGSQSLEELIQGVKRGILVHHCAWINPSPLTTRFGSEIRNAQEIVNGELGEGIVGGTLSGSALDLIRKLTGLSDEPEVVSASAFGCVAPYMRFEGVQISGPS